MTKKYAIKNRILIVDDEKDIVTLLAKRLKSAGYNVYKAFNGQEALRTVVESAPDLILLDIMMPGMDGMEVKKNLLQNPNTDRIPVIFLSAKGTAADKIQGFKLGVDDYITKPFNSDELVARVNALISRKVLYEKISMTDGLTGLYNVGFFKKQFNLFFRLARRYEQVFSIAIIDINNFKNINDSYGHDVGDNALRLVAEVLKTKLRKTDIVTRYGGDEFAIILPASSESKSRVAVNRVSEMIKSTRFHLQNEKIDISLNVCFGIAAYDEKMTDENEMFKLADTDLYKAKSKEKRTL